MRYLSNVTSLELSHDKCTGCGRCTEVCPHSVFVLDNGRAKITDKNTCMECGACAKNCAADAIAVNAGVGCAAALFYSLKTGEEPTCGCSTTGSSGTSGCC